MQRIAYSGIFFPLRSTRLSSPSLSFRGRISAKNFEIIEAVVGQAVSRSCTMAMSKLEIGFENYSALTSRKGTSREYYPHLIFEHLSG